VVALTQLSRIAVPWRYRDLFLTVAKETGEDENLLHALAWHESDLNPAAVSKPNANGTRDYGMMQINEINFRGLGLNATTALDAGANVRAAARLLKTIRTQGRSLPDVLSIYNAGAKDPDGAGPAPAGARLTASGAYVNSAYVIQVLSRYLWVQLGALAPLQKLQAV